MRDKIIQAILNNKDEFISGEELSKNLGVSRAAVWKHINALKENGYKIESVNRKGYRLIEEPLDLLTYQNICHKLDTKFIGKNIIHFDTIGSTNDYAKQIADNQEDGTVIISEEQTKGKGRVGRSFQSNAGEGIWMSLILKPDIIPSEAPFITLIAGASISKALNELGIKTSIKWPNDIILNGKKLCGVLTELSAEIERVSYIVLGIGINVKTLEFSDEIANVATSLYKEDYKVSRVEIVRSVLSEFEMLYMDYIKNKSKEMTLNICRSNSAVIGKDVYVIRGGEKELATCLDINEEGNLIIKGKDGSIKEVVSGEISIRGLNGYI